MERETLAGFLLSQLFCGAQKKRKIKKKKTGEAGCPAIELSVHTNKNAYAHLQRKKINLQRKSRHRQFYLLLYLRKNLALIFSEKKQNPSDVFSSRNETVKGLEARSVVHMVAAITPTITAPSDD